MANFPPSSWTMGRKSGGITGMTVNTMSWGRFPERRSCSTTSRRLSSRFLRPSLGSAAIWAFSSLAQASRSRLARTPWIPSAPAPTSKPFG